MSNWCAWLPYPFEYHFPFILLLVNVMAYTCPPYSKKGKFGFFFYVIRCLVEINNSDVFIFGVIYIFLIHSLLFGLLRPLIVILFAFGSRWPKPIILDHHLGSPSKPTIQTHHLVLPLRSITLAHHLNLSSRSTIQAYHLSLSTQTHHLGQLL